MFLLLLHIFISCIVGGCFTVDNGSNLIIAYADDNLQDEYGNIIYSSVIFRHGDRVIDRSYPTDPTPASVWPEGYGQLTVEGKKREYNLGKWLRQRYQKNLIVGGYKSDLVTTNSTDLDRTLMTAELVLAGLFPPSEQEMWNDENLRWQPIPVHTVPSGVDSVFSIQIPCERYDLEESLLNTSPEFEAFYRNHEDVFRYVEKYSGIEMSSDDIIAAIKLLWELHDILSIEESSNITLPNWTKKIYPEPIQSLGKLLFTAETHEMNKLTIGPIWNRMVEDMQKKRSGQLNQNLQLYSGHDVTISDLLLGLNMYNNIPPPCDAALIVELRQKQDIFIVTVLYKNSTTDPPYLLEIPGCSDRPICTLDEFLILTKDLVLADRQKECQVNVFEKLYYLIQLHPTVFLILICCILIVFILLTIKWIWDKKFYKQYDRLI